MMAGEVDDRPGGGSVASAQDIGYVDHGAEVELHAAPAPGLVIAQQAAFVQSSHRLVADARRGLSGGRLGRKQRHDTARTAQGFFVIDVCKAAVRGIHGATIIA